MIGLRMVNDMVMMNWMPTMVASVSRHCGEPSVSGLIARLSARCSPPSGSRRCLAAGSAGFFRL